MTAAEFRRQHRRRSDPGPAARRSRSPQQPRRLPHLCLHYGAVHKCLRQLVFPVPIQLLELVRLQHCVPLPPRPAAGRALAPLHPGPPLLQGAAHLRQDKVGPKDLHGPLLCHPPNVSPRRMSRRGRRDDAP